MKMEATIRIQYEGEPGQVEYVLEVALARGIGDLKSGIEYGARGGSPTRIKHGSVKCEILDKTIS